MRAPTGLGIQAKIFAICLPSMLLAPAWVSSRSVLDELRRVREQDHAAAYAAVETSSSALAEWLQRALADLELLARIPSIGDFYGFGEIGLPEEAEEHRARIREFAGGFRQRDPTYAGAGLFDPRGELIAGGGTPDRLPLPDRAGPVVGSLDAGQALRISGPGRAVVTRALTDPWGVVRGHVAVFVDLQALAVRIGRLRPEERLVLLDPRGGPLATAPPGPGFLAPAARGQPDEGVAGSMAAATKAPVRLASASGADSYLFASSREVAGIRLALLVPSTRLYQGVDRLQRQATQTAVLSAIVALILAAWIASRLGKRISRLAEAADGIGEGNFDILVPVDSDDELGRLASAFNEMSLRVETTQQALEQRIEEAENARDSLVQAEKLSVVGLLASGIAHELNTPLMTVGTLAGSLRRLAEKPAIDRERLVRYAAGISNEVYRASEITLNLQQYCRSGSSSFEPVPFRIAAAVERAMVLVRTRKDALKVSQELETGLEVMGDATRLSQVVVNLLLNALDATTPDQEVRIGVGVGTFSADDLARERPLDPLSPFLHATRLPRPRSGQRAVVLEVKDAGAGIPPEHLAKIFDPFFTTKAAGKGTGLGLSIVQGIVWSHGGLIRIDSQVGRGTVVTVKLPARGEGTGIA